MSNEYFTVAEAIKNLKNILLQQIMPIFVEGREPLNSSLILYSPNKKENQVVIYYRISNVMKSSGIRRDNKQKTFHEFGSYAYSLFVGVVSGMGCNLMKTLLSDPPGDAAQRNLVLERFDLSGKDQSQSGEKMKQMKVEFKDCLLKDWGEFNSSIGNNYFWSIVESTAITTTKLDTNPAGREGQMVYGYTAPITLGT
jgi:hypothetical protein